MKIRVALFAALAASSSASFASQEIPEGQDAADRPHPEYSQVGVNVGGFQLLPSVTSSLEATNNYRATSVDERSNVSLLLRPDLTWRSNWSRHRIDGNVFLQQRLNAPLHEENVTSYGIRGNGVYDFSRDARFRIGGLAERLAESRRGLNSFQAAVEPVRYDVLRLNSTLSKSFNAIEVRGTANFDKLNYHDAELAGGQRVSQDYRDYRAITLGGSAEYDFQNGVGIIVTARHFDNNYDFGPGSGGFIPGISINRDSSGITAQAGLTLELSNLIFGTIQAGYLTQDYKDERLKDVSSPSFTANLLWNVTPLTSLVGTARRWVEESASTVSAGNVRSDFGVEVHHELYRHLLLTGTANLGRYKPVSLGSRGTEYSGTVGARYLMNRRVTINGELGYWGRHSNNNFQRYHAAQATLSVRYGI